MKMEKEQAHWIYKTMNEIRFFEEKVHKIFSDGRIPGFVHLYVGEEAVATGVMSQLNDDDYITSTHRGHGHAIAKGCDLNGMMAEIMGKRDGLGHGKGGSMHVAEMQVFLSLIKVKIMLPYVSLVMVLQMKVISMKVLILLQF